jgi:hypothetical protein
MADAAVEVSPQKEEKEEQEEQYEEVRIGLRETR